MRSEWHERNVEVREVGMTARQGQMTARLGRGGAKDSG
jgi:hypothetical protein